MVGIYGGSVSEVEEGEGVTKTGTYVSFECVLKIVDRSDAFKAVRLGVRDILMFSMPNKSPPPPPPPPIVDQL